MLAIRIAWRYLRSKKAHSVVNIISAVSVCGVIVATAALVCVLSVFNGFSNLIGDRLSQLDPDIAVFPKKGKTIACGDSLCDILSSVSGVESAVSVVQDNALAVFDINQMPVVIKGVPKNYQNYSLAPKCIIDGSWMLDDEVSKYGVIGVGPAIQLGVRSGYLRMVQLYTPKRKGVINVANPVNAFKQDSIFVGGIVQFGDSEIDQDIIFVPIDMARGLLDYDKEATCVEVSLENGANEEKLMHKISSVLGPDYLVQNRIMQRSAEFKMVNVEKWVTFLLLAFILVIATFNVISALSLLIIEKDEAITTLRNLGASKNMIISIFVAEGWIISLLGTVIGLTIGLCLCLAQHYFGIITMGGDTATALVSYYPVVVEFSDIIVITGLVILVGLFTSLITSLTVRNRIKIR